MMWSAHALWGRRMCLRVLDVERDVSHACLGDIDDTAPHCELALAARGRAKLSRMLNVEGVSCDIGMGCVERLCCVCVDGSWEDPLR